LQGPIASRPNIKVCARGDRVRHSDANKPRVPGSGVVVSPDVVVMLSVEDTTEAPLVVDVPNKPAAAAPAR
jgi:hypothetical protein